MPKVDNTKLNEIIRRDIKESGRKMREVAHAASLPSESLYKRFSNVIDWRLPELHAIAEFLGCDLKQWFTEIESTDPDMVRFEVTDPHWMDKPTAAGPWVVFLDDGYEFVWVFAADPDDDEFVEGELVVQWEGNHIPIRNLSKSGLYDAKFWSVQPVLPPAPEEEKEEQS